MKDNGLSVQDIKELMSAMNKNRIGALKLEQEGFTLKLEGCRVEQVAAGALPTPPPVFASAPGDDEEPSLEGTVVRSPIVGTFYAAPAPDKDPFVRVGSRVEKGDVLFIIESMKLMNEVLAEQAGTVTQILAENAQGVEYGQPILCLE